MSLPIWITDTGNIGTVLEGNSFSYTLDYSNPDPSPLNISLVSGNLPDGLVMDSSGNITGTASYIASESEYSFTVRLENSNGIVDRWFSIIVTNETPVWPDPSVLGSVVFYSYYEYQFHVVDAGGQNQKFVKIAGELPKGLELSENGLLKGFLEEITTDTLYTFTIRVYLDDEQFQDKTFTLNVLVSGNRPPVWNTPRGKIGDIDTINNFSFQFSAGDPDGDSLTFSAVGLPPGLTLSSAGFLSGLLTDGTQTIYTFNIIVTDGVSSVSRLFSLNANGQDVSSITWITPAGLIGEINEGEKSLFGVKAESTGSLWLRYEVVSGSLPSGLTLDVNTGDIWGMPLEQGTTTDYSFEVKAYNSIISENRTFIIKVVDFYKPSATDIQVYLWGPDKEKFNDLFTSSLIPSNSWFRQGDSQYGLVEKPRLLMTVGLDNPSRDEIFNKLLDVRRTNLVLGKIEYAKAVKDSEIVYEVLFRKVYDEASGSLLEFTSPQTGQLIKPGALENCRERLLELPLSGTTEQLPLWMTSEQIIGDSSSVIGWIPALVFAYVKPGTASGIADKMNSMDVQQEKLLNRYVRVDRFVMEPTADTSFQPDIILYDNQY